MITQVPSISPKILFSTHAQSIFWLDIISWDHALKGDICIEHVDTLNQLANIFTKPLNKDQFCKIRRELGMIDVNDVWTFMIVESFCKINLYDVWTCMFVEHFLVHSCMFRHWDSVRPRKLEISYLRKFHNDWVLRNKAKLNPKVCKGKIGFFSWKELCDENIMGIRAELIKLEVKGLNWETLRSWGLACNLPKTFYNIFVLFFKIWGF